MKIIQAYSHFDNGGYQYTNKKLTGNDVYLLFYTFLLSYLTLKKYYGFVIMYCNKKAYDLFIKYIPYDKIIIRENKYSDEYCYAYKLDIIDEQTETFIHVDPDVFIFDDLFKNFIDNQDKYDILAQFIDKENFCINKDEIDTYKDIIASNYFIEKDFRLCINNFSTGVVGMNIKVKDVYIQNVKKIYNLMLKDKIKGSSSDKGWILEEVTLYLTAAVNNFTNYSLFGELHNACTNDIFLTIGNIDQKNVYNYTHLWWIKKFKSSTINKIKNIIKIEFKEQYYLIDNYEKIIKNIEIFSFDDDDKSIIKFKI